MYNIKFLINNNTAYTLRDFYIIPAYIFIRHFYNLHGKHVNQINWLPCEYAHSSDIENDLKVIKNQKVDILCLSIAVWNEDKQFEIAKRCKEENPSIIIIAGGAQLTAHKDPEFFKNHPYMDYVVYGDGEKAFQLLIDNIITGDHVDADNLVNTVINSHKKTIVSKFEILRDKVYFNTSAYISLEETVLETLNNIKKYRGNLTRVIMMIEFTRGCMYKCSFCDWSHSLHQKMVRKTFDMKKELDFFCKLDIVTRETDSNFGQYDEDLDYFDYAESLRRPEKQFHLSVKNTPKLKAEATYYILNKELDYFSEHKVDKFVDSSKIALQDINLKVLEAVDRPAIPWKEQVPLINQLKIKRKNVLEKKYQLITLETILGLPEQSLESWIETLETIHHDVGDVRFSHHNWVLLPNAYSSAPGYLEKYSVVAAKTYYLYSRYSKYSEHNVMADDYNSNIEKLYLDVKNKTFPGNFEESFYVIETSTARHKDILAMHRLTNLYNTTNHRTSMINNIHRIKNKILAKAYADEQIMTAMYKKYGFMIPCGYDKDDNLVSYERLTY